MKNRLLTAALLVFCLTANAQNFDFTADIHTKEYDGLTIYLIKTDVVDKEKLECVDSCKISDGMYHFSMMAPDSAYWAVVALPLRTVTSFTHCQNSTVS